MSQLATPRQTTVPPPDEPTFVPPLENGDRLTRHEFERRYRAMPSRIRAELIEGVVVMASPVRADGHGDQHADLLTWAGIYRLHTPGVRCSDNATVRLDLDNEPQPDVCLYIDPARGGAARIVDGYIEGAPEFVAEVAASTVSHDLGPKLTAYRRNGVREYLVWRVQDAAVDWFVLRDGRFDPLPPGADAVTRSEVLPGLWLDTAALARGDLVRVHAVLHQGLADAAHTAFIARLTPPA
ncbi:MAG: Uma2 family endonuclease [Gemmataceae bacterium]